MDLDDFKEINDNHGHHVGDRALREVAGVLRAAIRPYDICVRYAGDEFIVVLSGCGADEAERKRLELQTAIDEVVFEARPGKRLQLGISIGAAMFPHDGNTYETLLATADSRMYRDKKKRKRTLVVKPEMEPLTPSRREPVQISDHELQQAASGVLCRSSNPKSLVLQSLSCRIFRLDPVRPSPADSRQAATPRRSRRAPAEPIGHRRLPGIVAERAARQQATAASRQAQSRRPVEHKPQEPAAQTFQCMHLNL